jgi:hypothetical protein
MSLIGVEPGWLATRLLVFLCHVQLRLQLLSMLL